MDGDQTRLVQVVANILHNAAKFMEPGGEDRLTVTRDGPHAVIKVPTPASASRRRCCRRSSSCSPRRTPAPNRSEGGLGIGLALVRRLTEMHGGTVTAHSDGPGRGTEMHGPAAGAGTRT